MTTAVFQPRKHWSMRRQIADHLRQAIRTKRYAPGTRLPSTQALAAEYKTHVPTVHQALQDLVREQLLVRTPRVGTFVRQRAAKLTRIGLYLTGEFTSDVTFRFVHMLQQAVNRLCREEGMELSTWVDPRPKAAQTTAPQALLDAIAEGEVQAVLAPMTDLHHLPWQCALPVPVTFLTSEWHDQAVLFDYRQFLDDGLAALAAQGCRRPGIITVLPMQSVADARLRRRTTGSLAVEEFRELARGHGLTTDPGWIRTATGELGQASADIERFGYESTLSLLQGKSRPDGLLVFTDIAAQGVLLALAHRHVRVPEDLCLALHRNAACGLFCPVPAAFLDVDERAVAAALLAQLRRQHGGEAVTPVVLWYGRRDPR